MPKSLSSFTQTNTDSSSIEGTSNFINMTISTVVNVVSYTIGISGSEAIDFVIQLLEAKKTSNLPIVGGSMNLNEIQTGIILKKSSRLIQDQITNRISKGAPKLTKKYRGGFKKDLNQKIKTTKSECSAKLNSTKDLDIEIKSSCKVFMSSELSAEHQEVVSDLEHCFQKVSAKKFYQIKEKYADKCYITDEHTQITMLKRHSLSVGLHDRFHSSGIFDDSHLSSSNTLIQIGKKLLGSCQLRSSKPLPASILNDLNSLIESNRSSSEKKLLLKHGWKNDHKHNSRYQLSETVTYYRDLLNGRPDAVLLGKDGKVLGVVEIKSSSSKPTSSRISTFRKQSALYQHLLMAVEAYLYIYPSSNSRFKPILIKIQQSTLEKVCRELPILKSNFEKFMHYLSSSIDV